MSRYNELPIYLSTYNFTLEIFKLVKDFSREYKYTIGETLKKETLELIMLLCKINSTPQKERKNQLMNLARESVESIRLLLRLSYDLNLMRLRRFSQISLKLENISRQLVGWQKKSING
jgi:hypothetical protein